MSTANREGRIRHARPSWVAAFGATALWSFAASAQPAAVEQHTEAAAADQFQADVTALNASLGGSLNTGNTQAWQLNAGSAFALVRGRHGFQLAMEFSYGRADLADDGIDEIVDTVRNFRSRNMIGLAPYRRTRYLLLP